MTRPRQNVDKGQGVLQVVDRGNLAKRQPWFAAPDTVTGSDLSSSVAWKQHE